jgi:hypothetical protein
MPAFMFEKISPPAGLGQSGLGQISRAPIPPVANKKQRGVIVQMLDRFVEARVKRSLRGQKCARPQSPPTSRLEPGHFIIGERVGSARGRARFVQSVFKRSGNRFASRKRVKLKI